MSVTSDERKPYQGLTCNTMVFVVVLILLIGNTLSSNSWTASDTAIGKTFLQSSHSSKCKQQQEHQHPDTTTTCGTSNEENNNNDNDNNILDGSKNNDYSHWFQHEQYYHPKQQQQQQPQERWWRSTGIRRRNRSHYNNIMKMQQVTELDEREENYETTRRHCRPSTLLSNTVEDIYQNALMMDSTNYYSVVEETSLQREDQQKQQEGPLLKSSSSITIRREQPRTNSNKKNNSGRPRYQRKQRWSNALEVLSSTTSTTTTTRSVGGLKPKRADKKTDTVVVRQQQQQQQGGRVKMWPPWPFNLLVQAQQQQRRRQQRRDGNNDYDEYMEQSTTNSHTTNTAVSAKHVYPSAGALLWAYLTQQGRYGFRQLQELASQLWFHTPPYLPPLLLMSIIPRHYQQQQQQLLVTAAAEQQWIRTTVIPLWSNAVVRNYVIFGLFLSIMSWSHSELHRKRCLVPLPLTDTYRTNIRGAILPPFLPEQVPELDFVVVADDTTIPTTTRPNRRSKPMPNSSVDAAAATGASTSTHFSTIGDLPHEDPPRTSTSSSSEAGSITELQHHRGTRLPSEIVVEDDEDVDSNLSEGDDTSKSMKFFLSSVPPRLRKHLRQTLNQMMIHNNNNNSSTTIGDDGIPTTTITTNYPWFGLQSTLREWKVSRQVRQLERDRLKRMAIYDELVALQKFKQQARQQQQQQQQKQQKSSRGSKQQPQNTTGSSSHGRPLGYALVTGSSRGIGRAIAVELARWDIPLILVARDRDRLLQLAYDLQACYGVKCCVLPADLSQPNAAQRIWETTHHAGLHVDVLINNAGFSIHGLYVDTPLKDAHRMMQVNAVAVAELNQLYGHDMKEQGRGRIMVVSSVNGDVAAGPTVALYSATKAFEKSLALGMAKELEPYGVGVTCLIPGAVRGTDFITQSKTDEALCWKIPFYPLSPASVAHKAVRGMLDGDVEVTPGWMNRAFLKIAKPILPQRIHNMIVELVWNPLRIDWPTFRRQRTISPSILTQKNLKSSTAGSSTTSTRRAEKHHATGSLHRPRGAFPSTSLNLVSPPRLLEMEDDEEESQNLQQTEEQEEESGAAISSSTSISESQNNVDPQQSKLEIDQSAEHDTAKQFMESSPLNDDDDDIVSSTAQNDANRLMMMD